MVPSTNAKIIDLCAAVPAEPASQVWNLTPSGVQILSISRRISIGTLLSFHCPDRARSPLSLAFHCEAVSSSCRISIHVAASLPAKDGTSAQNSHKPISEPHSTASFDFSFEPSTPHHLHLDDILNRLRVFAYANLGQKPRPIAPGVFFNTYRSCASSTPIYSICSHYASTCQCHSQS